MRVRSLAVSSNRCSSLRPTRTTAGRGSPAMMRAQRIPSIEASIGPTRAPRPSRAEFGGLDGTGDTGEQRCVEQPVQERERRHVGDGHPHTPRGDEEQRHVEHRHPGDDDQRDPAGDEGEDHGVADLAPSDQGRRYGHGRQSPYSGGEHQEPDSGAARVQQPQRRDDGDGDPHSPHEGAQSADDEQASHVGIAHDAERVAHEAADPARAPGFRRPGSVCPRTAWSQETPRPSGLPHRRRPPQG